MFRLCPCPVLLLNYRTTRAVESEVRGTLKLVETTFSSPVAETASCVKNPLGDESNVVLIPVDLVLARNRAARLSTVR